MKVTVKNVRVIKGKNAKGEEYAFASVLVMNEDGKTADWVNVDSSVCPPENIKAGMKFDLYTPSDNKNRATVFDPIGLKNEVQVQEAPEGGYSEVSPEDYNIDSLTGEVKEKNKK